MADSAVWKSASMDMETSLPLPFTSRQAGFQDERVRLDEDIAKEDEWRWAVAQTFFDHRGLVTDHITSYNNFVKEGIHEMFEEAEPFEVQAPDEDRAIQKKVVVSFGEVELSSRPEVEKEDRAIEARRAPEETEGSEHSGDGAGKSKGKGGKGGMNVSWLTNDEAGPSSVAKDDAPWGSGKQGNNHDPKGDDDATWEDNGKDTEEDRSQYELENGAKNGKGKRKSMHYNLNVDGDSAGNETDEDSEEPPKISQETWGTEDPQSNEVVEEDPEEDGPSKLEPSDDDVEIDDIGQGKAIKAGKGGSKFSPFSQPRPWKTNLKLLPVEARMRGITYSSPIYVKVFVETTTQAPMPQKKSSKSSSSSSSSRRKPVTDKVEYKVLLGRIPVMVKSSLCHLSDYQNSREPSRGSKGDCSLDPGGYFIIKGSEKVIVAQEERNLQRLWLECRNGAWTASCITKRRGFSLYIHRTTVRLAVPKKTGAGQGEAWPLITVSIAGVEALPIGVLFSALGVSSDRDILEMISYSLDDAELVQTVCPSLTASDRALAGALKEWDAHTFARAPSKRDREVALFYIQSKTTSKKSADDQGAQKLLKERLLPHIGSSERSKALFLGYMVRTVVSCYLGRQQATDRDDMKNKRLEFAGEIISHQFRKLMGMVINTMKKRMQKHLSKGIELQGAETYLDDKVMTRGLKVAFTSGNWKGHDTLKTSGVVFPLNRHNPLATLCQLREFRHFVPPTSRIGDEARHPTFSQWGKVCPIDTPDNKSCGLVQNMALTGVVSCASPEGPVLKLLADAHVEDLESVEDPASLQLATKIFLNGRWIGTVLESREATRLANRIRKARRKGPANKTEADLSEVEVVQDHNRREVHISTDGGRILRPLLIVKEKDQTLVLNEEYVVAFQHNIQKNKRFQWLLQRGVLELLGIEEEEKAMVALHGEHIWNAKEMEHRGQKSVKFTHAEIHPSLVLGLSASLIPFPNHNQSARNLYQARKHSKQAIGVYVTNINSRADTAGLHLFYPQMQLVKTNAYECLQKPEMYSGQNAIVAVAIYTGYNQEDSIIMNQSSLDRGMFRTTHYRTVTTEERTDSETFGKPSELESTGEKLARSVEKLDEDGLPGVGLSLGVGDVIVGKICKSQSTLDSNARLTDRSQRLKHHEKGRVAQVILVQNEEGQKIAKVKLRESRMPQVGDKFSSMHGQKGVIGMVFTQEDLCFTNEGIVPDIIINPHAFPSRQTLGQMWESNQGKTVAKTGERHFATPFNQSSTVESMLDSLHNAGYERWGTETMYNGYTGEPMQASIFIGSTFYQRLDHMVEDKIKYRSRGHVHPLTRQPVSDRKRNGGVKFGEMERDCLIAHGAAATLQERTFVLSDFHTVHVCTNCEQMANWNADRVPACPHCSKEKKKGVTAVVKVELPYACKLLMQELMSMGISVRMKTAVM